MSRLDYTRVRALAYGLTEEDAGEPRLRVREIDLAALVAFKQSWEGRHRSGYGGFDWPYLWYRYCRQEVRSFHCALWHDSTLCGLAIGSVPRGHSFLTLRYMEGRPQGHPLQGHVAQLALAAAEHYARGLALPQVRLENPAPGLEDSYRRFGFALAYREGAIRYLAKELTSFQGLE